VDIYERLSQDPIAKAWPPDTHNTYLAFYQRLTESNPLIVKIGKGGLSFYKEIDDNPVFVCHFNAMPQRGRNELGFADFRFDILSQWLNTDTIVQTWQKMVSAEIRIKTGKRWVTLHFPLTRVNEVADLFNRHIIARVK
jgi:hypothetical protein